MSEEKINSFFDAEITELMLVALRNKGINTDHNEALSNIEFLLEAEYIPKEAHISDYQEFFIKYMADRRNAFAQYLALNAKAELNDALALVKELISNGDIQKEMYIDDIKKVLDANVLNVSFYDGNKKEEKKEEKPKVSEQPALTELEDKGLYNMDRINSIQELISDEMEKQGIKPRIANDWSVSVTLSDATDQYQRHAFTMPSGNAYNVSMHDGANALEAMRLVFEFEKFVKLMQDAGAKFGKGYRQVPQQQYGDVERHYTPPANEKPAQPKGANTQQESVNDADMRDRKIIGLSKHTDTGKKGEYTYYKPYYWDADKKQMSGIGMIFTNSAIAKEIAKIVPADVLNSLGEMPTTLPPSAVFTAFYTVKENGDKKYSTFHRVEKAGQ